VGAFAFPLEIAGIASIPLAIPTGTAVAHPVATAGIGQVPPPSDVGQIRGEWPQHNGGGWGSSSATEWPQSDGGDWETGTAAEWPQHNDEEWELVP
jgi:hypothetical protein